MKRYRYYTALVGSRELSFYGDTDEYAVAVVRRWIRLFWHRYVEDIKTNHMGSIACAVACGWWRAPEVQLWSLPINDAGVIQCSPARLVMFPEPIQLIQQGERLCPTSP